MPKSIKYYWEGNKSERAKLAQSHTQKMNKEFKKEIEKSIKETKVCGPGKVAKFLIRENINLLLWDIDTVKAIFKANNDFSGDNNKIGVLNFASYKNAGGGFMAGSRAQEECLCHQSYLYNVISQFPQYYEKNNKNLNHGLYTDRALYSPYIRFTSDDNTESCYCDVITCAAPNISPAIKYNNEDVLNLNDAILQDRCEYVLDVAARNEVDILILGAFGCGVFGQDAEKVAKYFIEAIKNKYRAFKFVIFAVPNAPHKENFEKIQKVFMEYQN